MLMPKRVKYRRVQRGRMKGKATRGNVVNYGEFGLAAQEPGLNPELIRAALCAECPDLTPDLASFCRREILDGEGKVFR